MGTKVAQDPRKVGGVYFSGYWRCLYRVDAVDADATGEQWFTVTWDDGRETTHCTAWDSRRDRVWSA